MVLNHVGQELQIIKNFLNENHIKKISFLDIGANTGKFYEELSKDFEIEYCVLIEPMKDLFEYIKLKYSDKKNIFLYNIALSDEQGKFELNTESIDYWKENINDENYKTHMNLGVSSLTRNIGQTDTYTLEYFWNNLTKKEFNFIKIDTENRDLQIIKDLSKIIDNNLLIKPLILFENNYFMSSGLSMEHSNEEAQKIVDNFCQKCYYKTINIKNGSSNCVLYPL